MPPPDPRLLEQANRKQLLAELNPKPRDPFAGGLGELVGGEGVASVGFGARRGAQPQPPSILSAGSQAGGSQIGSQIGGGSQCGCKGGGGSQRGSAGSQISVARGSQISVARGSQISVARSQQSQRSQRSQRSNQPGAAANDGDARSTLSGVTSLSWRTPSTIRSSEPSEIARNKIAELQLRLELERVLRLQRETELEAQRAQNLTLQAKADKNKE